MNDQLDEYLNPPFLLQCGCGIFHPHDDYPFVTCAKCGYINCGTKDELKKAEIEGKLMKRVFWKDLTDEQKKKLNDDAKQEEEFRNELEEEEELWETELDYDDYY